jgi:hypothetical protein
MDTNDKVWPDGPTTYYSSFGAFWLWESDIGGDELIGSMSIPLSLVNQGITHINFTGSDAKYEVAFEAWT